MHLEPIEIQRDIHSGQGCVGAFYSDDTVTLLPELLNRYEGQVQSLYIDPPFATGKSFYMHMRVGEKDWSTGSASLNQVAYTDHMEKGAYLAMMRAVIECAHQLLNERGVVFLHIDYRMHAPLRLMMDEVFGEDHLLNEIVWTYQSGGRARRHFSRKHDIILFYRKSARYYFDIRSTGIQRPEGPSNHMKKHVDADGRIYRSIRSGGKIYTYYDDDPVFPSDVWDDVSHLQQKDPQRTGYDTQKPARLMERIIRCSTRPNDLVMDLFAGSGTTLDVAHALGRRFVGVDRSAYSLHVIRQRLEDAPVEYHIARCEGQPVISLHSMVGVGYYELTLTDYHLESGVSPRRFDGLDALDNWSAGYLRDGTYEELTGERRSKARPCLSGKLRLPVLTGDAVVRFGDVLGRYFYYRLDKDGMDI